jgi:chitinase
VAFAQTLRSLFSSDPSKEYYLSAAPQCPYPDASDPMALMALADFVWVQFYNNYCSIGTSYFDSSLQQWSSALAAQNSSTQLLVGVLGWSAGGSGYVDPSTLTSYIQGAKALNLPNFGGVMMWDGAEAHANVDSSGRTYVTAAKQALDS